MASLWIKPPLRDALAEAHTNLCKKKPTADNVAKSTAIRELIEFLDKLRADGVDTANG